MNEITARKIVTDFKLVMEDVEELIKATAGQTGERIGTLRQSLAKKLEDGRKSLAETAWFRRAEETKTEAESRLRENPWTGVAVATGIGVLFGWLLRRK
jgi:ElaB/YqjD/DUF883 family membrane-anchored ribosome-binding protein